MGGASRHEPHALLVRFDFRPDPRGVESNAPPSTGPCPRGGEALDRLAADLAAKGRALVAVDVEVMDEERKVALVARVEWFLARTPRSA